MSGATLQEQLGEILTVRGWRLVGFGVRCWQDPLRPDGELLGVSAALSTELRREADPGVEVDRALHREGLLKP